MTFRDLKSTVNALSAHDLTPTGIDSVRVEGGGVVFEFDGDFDLIAELRAELADAEKELEAEQKRANELENARDDLQDLLDEVKDAETGVTLREYRERCERAEQRARESKALAALADAEAKVLRARKGIGVGLIRHWHEVWTFLGYVAQSRERDWGRYVEDAKRLLDKINRP